MSNLAAVAVASKFQIYASIISIQHRFKNLWSRSCFQESLMHILRPFAVMGKLPATEVSPGVCECEFPATEVSPGVCECEFPATEVSPGVCECEFPATEVSPGVCECEFPATEVSPGVCECEFPATEVSPGVWVWAQSVRINTSALSNLCRDAQSTYKFSPLSCWRCNWAPRMCRALRGLQTLSVSSWFHYPENKINFDEMATNMVGCRWRE